MVKIFNWCVLILCLNEFVSVTSDCPVELCEWFPWNDYEPCNGQCGGGVQERFRYICCYTHHSLYECLDHCGKDISDRYGSRACTGKCSNGGTYDGNICICRSGYTGTCCDEECAVGLWGNGCTTPCYCDNVGSSSCDKVQGCVCVAGWQGVHCDEDVNECDNVITCPGYKQVCVNTQGSYTCGCTSGYQLIGLNTCVDYNECDDPSINDCSDICNNEEGGFSCLCYTGYVLDPHNDRKCIDYNECDDPSINDCSHICNNKDGGFSCSCYTGYILDPQDDRKCIDYNECEDPSINDCSDICNNAEGGFSCSCYTGYVLDHQDDRTCIDYNECDDPSINDCSDICNNAEGGFSCSCYTGYVLDPQDDRNCMDINECALGDSGCEHNCENIVGSYNCLCDFGYTLSEDGRTCRKVAAVEVCEGLGLTCEGFCIVGTDTATCGCGPGYQLDQGDMQSCIDVKECEDASLNMCGFKESCVDTPPGSYTCSCPIGQKLESNGRTCRDCVSGLWGNGCTTHCNCDNVGSSSCDNVQGCFCVTGWQGVHCDEDVNECDTVCIGTNHVCTNTHGSYTCGCTRGFRINDAAECIDYNECEDPSMNDCSDICNNEEGGFSCSCYTGYKLDHQDDTKCIDYNECVDSSINDCTDICNNEEGGFSCSCYTGYVLDPQDDRNCIDYNECKNSSMNDCSDICNNEDGGFSCSCYTGYVLDPQDDRKCIDMDECSLGVSGCEHNCQNVVGSYNCQCDFGYTLNEDRRTCRKLTAVEVCEGLGLTCEGFCIVGTDTATCGCGPGYYLDQDDLQSCLDVKECQDANLNMCDFKESCVDTPPGLYTCSCPIGQRIGNDGHSCTVCDEFHYGKNCVYLCLCGDGASRCDPVTGCVCNAGYWGTRCQNDINECHASPSPCQEAVNTDCVNTFGSYRCDCREGYGSIDNVCTDIDECANEVLHTCEQICENTISSYTCSCRAGYTQLGNTCEDIDECESSPCQRGGTCRNMENGYECICPDNAYGVHCEQDICQPRPSDIVFVLDSSASMTEADFRKQLDFIALFVDELTIGPQDFQIAVITFSFDSKIEFSLNTHQTNVSLKEAVYEIAYRPGATFTHTGLESARDVFDYEETNSNRPTIRSWPVQKYVFVLTDGMSNYKKKTKEAAKILRNTVHHIIAIGIGFEVSHKELLDIATTGDVYSVDNFNSLYTIIQQLIHDRCQKCYSSDMSDIVFLIDESSYIEKHEFQIAIDDITYLINNMETYGADTGPHIAINKFGEDRGIKPVLNLNNGKIKSMLLPFLQNLIQKEGSCHEKNQCDFNITEAIKETIQDAFLPEKGGRENAKKLVIILSNGQFDLATNEIGHNNVTLFVIGLGLGLNMDGLLSLVNDPNYVFLTRVNEEPTNLDVIQTEFTYSVCDHHDET